MINQYRDLLHLTHPLFTHLPPTVLQYADDTLIIAKASNDAALQLKNIFHNFAMATGLMINFTKTTFVPMHVCPTLADSIAATLQCTTSTFPQIYLGLPLAPTRLPPNAFLPIIERCQKFLTGW
uniref:Reverse transcriptase domain-containing protein n=1 Tax=Triticum urartu TaxID=4572 RepID=A0A8R7VHP8_TRIUA